VDFINQTTNLTMSIKLITAFLFYILGLAKIIDWFVFSSQNRALKNSNYDLFITKYENKFPSWLQPLFNTAPDLAAIISIATFTIAGLIFIREKGTIYSILGVTSFVFAFLNLFSLM
jgi:hypothetical protein